MKLYNKSSRTYQHSYFDKSNKLVSINLQPKSSADIPNEVAKLWLKTGEIVEYVDPAEAKKAEEKASAKQAELEKENKALKAELEELKAKQKVKKETEEK